MPLSLVPRNAIATSSNPRRSSDHITKMSSYSSTAPPAYDAPTVNLQADHLDKIDAYSVSVKNQVLIGKVPNAEWFANHVLSPELEGRRALVYFTDTPAEYEFVKSSAEGCILRPSTKPTSSKAPFVHIDPRSLQDILNQVPIIRAEDLPTSQPMDAGPRTPKSKSGGGFPRTPASGKKSGNRRDGALQHSKALQRSPHPSMHKSYRLGVDDGPALRTSLPQCVIGAQEFLLFWPNHLQWHALMFRLLRNGWSTKEIAKAQLWGRGQLDRHGLLTRQNAIRHQQLTAIEARFPPHRNLTSLVAAQHADFQPFVNDPSGNNHNLYDVTLPLPTSGNPPILYEPPRNLPTALQPEPLSAIVRGTDHTRWPTGQDNGLVTQVLRWARANNQLQNYTTADIPNLATQLGFTLPTNANTNVWDWRAAARVAANIPTPP